jgi:predicted nuclease of predicted toxin-antitoxin system
MLILIWNQRTFTRPCIRCLARRGDCPPVGARPAEKFLADMGIAPTTVAFLQALGHDAVHLADQGLERLPDPGIVEKARQADRILLVHDLGFGELVAASGATLPPVITFRLRNMYPDRVNGALQSVLSRHGEALEHGAMVRCHRGAGTGASSSARPLTRGQCLRLPPLCSGKGAGYPRDGIRLGVLAIR